jgi:diacylglycerol O-acyltransferase
VRFVPGQLGRPVWVDDPHFNLAYHVRHTALPPPGGEEELNNLMGRLMAVQLDRHRPLWETWMVEGLAGGRWALISKVHHCMVDGISGTDLMVQLLDSRRHHGPPSPAPTWEPAAEPADAALVVDAVSDLVRTPAEQVRALRALIRRPQRAVRAARDFVQGTTELGRELRPTPNSSIDGTIGPHRRWAVARTSLDEVREIRREFGGTVNDVVLAAITGAFRDLLLERGERVDVELRSLVPMSVRSAGDHAPSNQVAMMIAELPVGIADPIERLTEIVSRMAALKASHRAQASGTMNSLAGFTPPMLYALGLRSASAALRHVPLRSVHTVTTNVPGPRTPLYALGREMLEYLPFVPLSQGVRIGVAILSYNGQIRFGVTGDYDTVPEVPWFCSRIEACMAELGERVRHGANEVNAPPLVS